MVASALLVSLSLAAPHPCRAALPRAPLLPAPLVFSNECGAYYADTSGTVRRLPRHWLARHGGGTGRRFEAKVGIRRNRAGRYILETGGRVVWRSHGLYPDDGGSIGFGPGEFAFTSYRRGVFLTDLRRGERLVARGRGLYPLDFTRSGDLIVGGGRTLALVSSAGKTLRRFRYRLRNGFTFDEGTDTLFFVTPNGHVAAVHDRRVEVGRRAPAGAISAQHGTLVFIADRSFTVTRGDGTRIAHTAWRSRRLRLDSGVSASADGRSFAFRLSDAHPGARSGLALVYVLRLGAPRPRLVLRHRLGPTGCAFGANLEWHRSLLLYSSADGRRAILDTATGRVTNLTALARALPGSLADVGLAADFRRAAPA